MQDLTPAHPLNGGNVMQNTPYAFSQTGIKRYRSPIVVNP